ncbi:MAG: DUF3168 domain-containing protein [Methanofastidiosum sp.]|jgi:hypothetical protein
MIYKALKDKLASDNELKKLINDRIYYVNIPQNPIYPCISFYRVSNPRGHLVDVSSPRFQIDIWAKKYSETVEIANRIRRILQRSKGVWDGISIIQGVYMNEFEDYESDTNLYHLAADYRIIYKDY